MYGEGNEAKGNGFKCKMCLVSWQLELLMQLSIFPKKCAKLVTLCNIRIFQNK